MGKRNAKKEFLNITKDYKIIAVNISFGEQRWNDNSDIFKLKPLYTQDEYDKLLDFLDREYDTGYGGQELFGVIYCEDGVWMQRDIDIKKWNIFKYPELRDSFDESDVIKYERYNKLKKLD